MIVSSLRSSTAATIPQRIVLPFVFRSSSALLNAAAAKNSPLHHQQKRTIFTYISDVVRSGSLSPTNPLLDSLQQQQQQQQPKGKEQHDTASSGTSSTPRAAAAEDRVQDLPAFSLAQPHHVTAAVEHVRQTQKTSLEKVHAFLVQQPKAPHPPTELSAASASVQQQEELDELIGLLNEAEDSCYTLRQMTSLLWLMEGEEDARRKRQWKSAAEEASSVVSVVESVEIQHKLRSLLESLPPTTDDAAAKELRLAANYLLTNYEGKTGERSFVPNENKNESTDDDQATRVESYQHLAEALQEVEESLINTKHGVVKPRLLADMYNFIGLRTEQAKLLGYRHLCEQVLSQRSAKIDEIRQLLEATAQRIVPQVVDDTGVKKSQEERELETYLSGADPGRDSVEFRHKMDRYMMLKLQEHVTLDGTLKFAFRLSQDLLGTSIVRDEEPKAWHKDVQLYHVFDEHNDRQYLGSFYIDPFAREGKHPQSSTIPIFPRGPHRRAVACMCLEIESPAWDTDEAVLKWQDCEAVLHEFAHCLQFILSNQQRGCLLGPQAMALDISEFLPKFMEHFLTEKSTLYTLIDLSQSKSPLSDEMIEIAYKVRAREKALQLAQLTYYSRLELELFSGFDLKGTETIVALQERLGKELIPHDVPDPKDATPLLDILQENARGRTVGWYRYLWCDVLSAAAFAKFKETYATDPGSVPKLGQKFRRLVLDPGAAVDVEAIRSEFEMDDCSPDLLCDRYGL